MNNIGTYILLFVCSSIVAVGMIKKINIFDEFLNGARDGLKCSVNILPALIALVTSVSMLRSSGAIEVISDKLSGILDLIGFPSELFPIALLRPISGSGALAAINDIFASYGPDSYIGRVASVIMGSTETTFYTIAVYFGYLGIKKTGYTIPAALTADIAGFILSALAVRLFFQ